MKKLSIITIVFLTSCVALLSWQLYRNNHVSPELITSVKYIHDTILAPIPDPIVINIVDYVPVYFSDTAIILSADNLSVMLPLEKKVYKTDKYKATLIGYHPNLMNMEIYNTNKVITQYKTTKLQFGIGFGVGYDPFQNKLYPTINAAIYVPIFKIW
jgi:hypothetical protein